MKRYNVYFRVMFSEIEAEDEDEAEEIACSRSLDSAEVADLDEIEEVDED